MLSRIGPSHGWCCIFSWDSTSLRIYNTAHRVSYLLMNKLPAHKGGREVGVQIRPSHHATTAIMQRLYTLCLYRMHSPHTTNERHAHAHAHHTVCKPLPLPSPLHQRRRRRRQLISEKPLAHHILELHPAVLVRLPIHVNLISRRALAHAPRIL